MTALYISMPAFFGEVCEVMRLFIDVRKIEPLPEAVPAPEGLSLLLTVCEAKRSVRCAAVVCEDGRRGASCTYTGAADGGTLERKRSLKRAAKACAYRALSAHFHEALPWGSLTGVRPTRLLRDSEARLGEADARALFLDEFDVKPEKYALAKAILTVQEGLVPRPEEIDVYVGIPFCTTRCAYCSFASCTPDVFKNAEALYIEALLRELSCAEELLSGRRVRALYVGGGTPTALTEAGLARVLARAAEIARGADEFTVEAGRPDTITPGMLEIIRESGAKRVSVNPQTLKDETLRRIGRAHTAAQFFEAVEMVRKAGFAVNVDVIAGLPGETAADTADTVRRVAALSPENVTVHTLAIKRASKFAAENMASFPADAEAAQAVDAAQRILMDLGYVPYYMYRQKYMKGCQQNTGFTLPGRACLYNIDIMEELCDVLAFGAGSISKRIFARENRIERAADIKDLRGYISRTGEMTERKRALFSQSAVSRGGNDTETDSME
jgi:oxygen-independent coproporphyrinogen-3 oxidase